jgi:hypothetical protein
MADAIGVQSSFMGGDGRPLLEPGALFVDGNYSLRLNAWCSVAGVTLALRSRFLRSVDGELVDAADQLAPTNNRLLTTSDVQLGVGFPLNVQVFALAGTPTIGQCFAQVQIVRGKGPASFALATVLQGYVTATQALSWPGSPIQSSLDGDGAVASFQLGSPAAGAQFTTTVPTNARRRLNACHTFFTADGTVANRVIGLDILDGTGILAQSMFTQNVTAGQVITPTWMGGYGAQTVTPTLRVGLSLQPDMPLLAGYVITSHVDNMQAGDQWSGPSFLFREWLDV